MRNLFLALALTSSVWADPSLRLSPLFTDHAVLQQGKPIRVWGQGPDGSPITVTLNGVSGTTKVEHGQWQTELPAQPAGGPYEMEIRSSNERVHLRDILVGDVYLCSGQSNMEWPLAGTENGEQFAEAAGDDGMRLLQLQHRVAEQPQDGFDSEGWLETEPGNVRGFSSVAYHFGQAMRRQRHVPIGLIQSTWGGTVAEAWTRREALQADPTLAPLLQPRAGLPPEDPNYASRLYNAMIAPLTRFPLTAVLWYQGESNAQRAAQYRVLFPTLISDWRAQWGQPDLPFLFVQLAPYQTPSDQPGESDWAELREAQRQTSLSVPNTAMVVIADVGDKDIHPPKKQPVGERLARAAMKLIFHQGTDWRGPTLQSAERQDGKVILTFDHVGRGLESRGGELTGFTLLGADGKPYRAHAEIQGLDKVVLSAEQVPQPEKVRFGWDIYPVVNLVDSYGLPASPFEAPVLKTDQ